MARAPARKPSRPSRRRADPDQLSFFDPAGALLSLQREERELRTQQSHHEDHRRFLMKALEQADARVSAAQSALERATGHAEQVASRQALPFQIEIHAGGSLRPFRSETRGAGLTAGVATAFSEAGIACNVVAAFHHDHLFVPAAEAEAALKALKEAQDAAQKRLA